ncbi:MAG: aminotransferase class I/II-fold pyridoxal phosphate-dependent enzyme [Synechococcaceae cyanobacterium]|nr:aminotransferase class I/II-fold pyridoxal phosphate-dependent enzyme [Synechococcaceae cyanobacterium]
MPISDRIARLGSGVFSRNDQRKSRYQAGLLTAEGTSAGRPATPGSLNSRPPLLDLSLGSTDLQPPAPVLEAMAAALQEPSSAAYCLHAATLPFREAVAAWARRRFDVEVDPQQEVLLLVGSQEGTAHLPLAVLNPGDRALLLDPCYPSHRGGLELASAVIETLPLRAAEGWRPDFQAIDAAGWEALKLMVLGFPHNPTARCGDQAWLDEAVALALRHDIVLAHDNPYVDLVLEGEAPALLRHPDWRRCGIEFFSLSKGWCLGGYRLAFAIGAPWLIQALRQLKAVVDFNQSLALQAGAITALTLTPDWASQLRPIYRERRDRMAAALAAAGWSAPEATMALYLWLPVPDQARARGLDSEAFCAALLEATGVCLTPGNGFGPGGEGWQRLALVHPVEELEAGARRIGRWLATL